MRILPTVILTLGILSGAALAGGHPSDAEDLRRIAALDGPSQAEALRAFLVDPARQLEIPPGLAASLEVYYEAQLRDSLRALLGDPLAGTKARQVLALIGDPDDLRLVVELAPPSRSGPFANRWAYSVACALLEPQSQAEWDFLREAATNGYDDRWVDAGAIQTLKLIASPRSRQILEEAREQNPFRAKSISRALEYVDSNPAPLAGAKLEDVAARVAQAVRIGKWTGNGKPRYNQARDKALVDSVFDAGDDQLTYTATFHWANGVWRLRGVRETLQAMVITARAVSNARPVIQLPPVPVLPSQPGKPATLAEILVPLPTEVSPTPAPK